MTLDTPRLPISVDPLIVEAKRRARQRRVLVVMAAVVVAAVGVGLTVKLRALGSVTLVPAKLTILAVEQNGGRALFHLTCDPAGGDVADPAKACAAIAAQPSIATNPKPFYDGGDNGAYFRITGSLNGEAVHFSGESDWTPQMALISKLGLAGPHGLPLRPEPLRHGSVGVNETHTFAPGILRPGDFVTCRIHHGYRGPALSMAVPIRPGRGGWQGAQAGVIAVRIRANRAVIASCLARKRMPLDKRGRTVLPSGWPPS